MAKNEPEVDEPAVIGKLRAEVQRAWMLLQDVSARDVRSFGFGVQLARVLEEIVMTAASIGVTPEAVAARWGKGPSAAKSRLPRELSIEIIGEKEGYRSVIIRGENEAESASVQVHRRSGAPVKGDLYAFDGDQPIERLRGLYRLLGEALVEMESF